MKWLVDPWVEHRPLRHRCNKYCPADCDHDGQIVNQSVNHDPWNAIVLHYTAGGHHSGSHTWFRDPRARASAHFLVGRDGAIVQAVPLDRRAWHAGDGEMANSDGEMCNPNYFSIGIEIANYGLLQYNDNQWYYEIGGVIHEYNAAKYGMPVRGRISYDTGKSIEGWWETYKTPQLSSVRKLVQRLVRLFDIPLNRVVGHQDIALPPGKKKDPGPLFPWRILKNMDGPVGDGTNHIRTQTELLDEI